MNSRGKSGCREVEISEDDISGDVNLQEVILQEVNQGEVILTISYPSANNLSNPDPFKILKLRLDLPH